MCTYILIYTTCVVHARHARIPAVPRRMKGALESQVTPPRREARHSSAEGRTLRVTPRPALGKGSTVRSALAAPQNRLPLRAAHGQVDYPRRCMFVQNASENCSKVVVRGWGIFNPLFPLLFPRDHWNHSQHPCWYTRVQFSDTPACTPSCGSGAPY